MHNNGDCWRALRLHWRRRGGESLRGLFDADPRRFARFSASANGILLDYSKTAIIGETLRLLGSVARMANFGARKRLMFDGGIVNKSERRAALHIALRADENATICCGGENIMPDVISERKRMLRFAEQCRREYADVVHIGIGGSDLGPQTAAAALQQWNAKTPRVHYVSNMDGAHLADALAGLDARRTMVIASSKTFTTAETLANAADALRWLEDGVGKSRARAQFVAITAAPEKARAFGARRVFRYWQWVGGRYSLWGAVGLPLAIAIGRRRFEELLQGARLMDEHFRAAPPRKNLPLLLAFVGVFHRTICGYPSRAVVPYEQHLHLLPAYLQQLDMESNGKSAAASSPASPVVWGAVATNAQHAFFQMLHQGADVVPCEFIVAARDNNDCYKRRRLVVANCLAQSAALMNGRHDKECADSHRRFCGNRPSITLMPDELTPKVLGALLALFEHRAFAEGTLWGVNPFDQFGVELGKEVARQIDNGEDAQMDSSTRGLMAHYRAAN